MSEGEGRTVMLGFRATPGETRRLDAAAEILRTTRSEIIRKATAKAVEAIRDDFDPEAHVDGLRRALEGGDQ